MNTRSYPGKESATVECTEIISLLGLRVFVKSLPSLSCHEAIITK